MRIPRREIPRSIIQEIPVPTIRQIPAPTIRELPPPVLRPPTIEVPEVIIDYPEIDVPTREEFEGVITPPEGEEDTPPEDTRDMPESPPPPPPIPEVETPVIELPGMEIPIPTQEVIIATGTTAFIATGATLAATVALKPVFEWLFKIFHAVGKNAVKKLVKKKEE